MIETAKAAGLDTFIADSLTSKRTETGFNEDKDLAKSLLKAVFCIRPQDQRFASARVISFNHDGTKALIEVYIDRGVLAEESYHVVIVKAGNQRKLFSINLISTS